MRPYADTPVRRSLQVAADTAGLLWCAGTVLAAQAVHEAVLALAAPGRALRDSGGDLADNLTGAARRLASLPFVGDAVSEPLEEAAGAARGLAGAGAAHQRYVADLAQATAWALLAGGLLAAVALWLVPRFHWMLRAAAARRAAVLPGTGGADLLALRALATGRLASLAGLGDDVVGGWRRGDRTAVERLAAYELARLGLRPPGAARHRPPP